MCCAQVTGLFSGYVRALLAEHTSNPAQNWKAKDCAMYLVVALAVRGRTAAAGVTSTNQLVDIQDFFNQQERSPFATFLLNVPCCWHDLLVKSSYACRISHFDTGVLLWGDTCFCPSQKFG
jgi:hypothetical protein